ncbi:MAG: PIN domain-containing protein [Thermodesulfovibrionales bacterium]
MDKVLVDTSAWIEFFRKKEPYYKIISDLMEHDKVCCIGIVIAELLQGAKSGKELSTLKEFVHVFDLLPETAALWQRAGELSFNLKKKGVSVGLSDCYIASIAEAADIRLLTLDKHFSSIVGETGLNLYKV